MKMNCRDRRIDTSWDLYNVWTPIFERNLSLSARNYNSLKWTNYGHKDYMIDGKDWYAIEERGTISVQLDYEERWEKESEGENWWKGRPRIWYYGIDLKN